MKLNTQNGVYNMSVEIVTWDENCINKQDLENNARRLILRLIEEAQEDFNLEAWEIALSHNIKETLKRGG